MKIGTLYTDFTVNAKQEAMVAGSDTVLTAVSYTGKQNQRKRSQKKCTRCKKMGHLEESSWKKHPELMPDKVRKTKSTQDT